MDLSNKIVTTETLTVVSYPPESTVRVSVSEEIYPGVFKTVGQYVFKFESIFSGFDDPNLQANINTILEQLP
jgi:hypothetical protein